MHNKGRGVGEATPLRETERALLVELESGEEIWIPKSVIHEDSEVWESGQDSGDLVVAEWFADKEGL